MMWLKTVVSVHLNTGISNMADHMEEILLDLGLRELVSVFEKPISRSQDAIIFNESIIVTFSYVKDEVAKFDLAVQGQHKDIICTNNKGLRSLCFIHNFIKICSVVPGKKIFKKFLLYIYGHGSHLGHVTGIMLMSFHLLVPKSLHSKFG